MNADSQSTANGCLVYQTHIMTRVLISVIWESMHGERPANFSAKHCIIIMNTMSVPCVRLCHFRSAYTGFYTLAMTVMRSFKLYLSTKTVTEYYLKSSQIKFL